MSRLGLSDPPAESRAANCYHPGTPAGFVNGVLTKLIRDVLTLRPEHRERLRARGLGDGWIDAKGYRSTPRSQSERRRAADVLAPYLDAFGGGVPGFYRGAYRWETVYTAP
ncbi:MAG TPA: hypothetical protein VNZ44_00335, partial [Pyrinomonadaceae bacterium]|nr:hypothetical protein [Pyrinomonadaceae bacterium]